MNAREGYQSLSCRNRTIPSLPLVTRIWLSGEKVTPVAAWLTKGWQTPSMGDEITDYKKFSMPKPKEAEGGLKGVVLRVDAFGNLITNFRAEHLAENAQENGNFKMQVGTQAVTKLVDTFAHGAAGEPIAYVGSSGYIEIGVNKGSAARTLALGRGTPVILPAK